VKLLRLLDLIIKEYIAIVETLTEDYPIEENRIIIEREEFKKLLGKYAYATFAEKIKAYKDLNLIIHDANNYTMPYKDKELKKTVRKVIINYKAYKRIKYLYNKEVNV